MNLSIYWNYYLKKKIASSFRFIIRNIIAVVFFIAILTIIYLKYFHLIETIDIQNINKSLIYISFYGGFFIHTIISILTVQLIRKQEIYFIFQTPVNPSQVIQFINFRSIPKKFLLSIFYFLLFLPVLYYKIDSSIGNIFFHLFLIILLYFRTANISILIKTQVLGEKITLSLISLLINFIPLLLWIFVDIETYKFVFLLNELILILLSFFIMNDFIKKYKTIIYKNISSKFLRIRKKKSRVLKNILKATTLTIKNPVMNEYFTNRLFSIKSVISLLGYIGLIIFYVIMLKDFVKMPLDEAVDTRNILIGMFIIGQLILTGVIIENFNKINWKIYKTLPLTFFNIFKLEITNFIKSFAVINIPIVILSAIIDWRLGIAIIGNIVIFPALSWLLSYCFIDKKIFSILIMGFIFLVHIALNILLSFFAVIPTGLIILIIYKKAKNNYERFEVGREIV